MHGTEDTTLGRAAHFNKAIGCIAHTIDRLKHSAMEISRHLPYIVISGPWDFLLQVTVERGQAEAAPDTAAPSCIWQSFYSFVWQFIAICCVSPHVHVHMCELTSPASL